MIRFLLAGLLFYIGYRIIASFTSTSRPPVKTADNNDAGVETHRDPVCGIYVPEETAVIGRHDGRRYYFCSMNCLEKYREQLDHSSPS